jgi:hypothetical protein
MNPLKLISGFFALVFAITLIVTVVIWGLRLKNNPETKENQVTESVPAPTPTPQNEFRFVLRPGQSSDPIETRGEYVSTEWNKGIPTTVTVIYDNGDCKRFHVTNRDHVDIPIRDWQYIKQLIYCRSGIPPRDSPYSVANWTNAPVEYRVRLL